VARHAKKLGIPLVAIVGDIGDDIAGLYDSGVSAVFSTNRVAASFDEARKRCREDLALTADNLFRFLKILKI
jgi:glycerate kinase